jgi:hypothetical protein
VLALDASGNADARRTARLWKERFDGALLGDVDAAFQSGFSRYRDAGVEIRDRSWSDAQGES